MQARGKGWRWSEFGWFFVFWLLSFAGAASGLVVFGLWFQSWGAASCLIGAVVIQQGLMLYELASR